MQPLALTSLLFDNMWCLVGIYAMLRMGNIVIINTMNVIYTFLYGGRYLAGYREVPSLHDAAYMSCLCNQLAWRATLGEAYSRESLAGVDGSRL